MVTEAADTAMKEKISLQNPSLYTLLFLLLCAVAAVVLTQRFGIDLDAVWKSVRTADPGLYLLAILSFYASLVVRAWRWRLLMQTAADPGEEGGLPSVMLCTQYVLIGRFADSVSLARVGGLYRAYLAAHVQGSSFSRIVGTTAAETVLDIALVFGAVLGVGALLSMQNSTAPAREAITAASVGAVLVMVGLLVMRRYGMAVARLLPMALGHAYGQFHRGVLDALGRRQMPLLFTLTGLGWLLAVARWYFVVAALGASLSFPWVLFVSLANSVIAAIPATPGGLGLVEPGVSALLALQLPVAEAIAITLSERFISYVSVVVTGGLLFLGLEVHRRWQETKNHSPL
jgi:uncharacterized protein (TIRG00374 family)